MRRLESYSATRIRDQRASFLIKSLPKIWVPTGNMSQWRDFTPTSATISSESWRLLAIPTEVASKFWGVEVEDSCVLALGRHLSLVSWHSCVSSAFEIHNRRLLFLLLLPWNNERIVFYIALTVRFFIVAKLFSNSLWCLFPSLERKYFRHIELSSFATRVYVVF